MIERQETPKFVLVGAHEHAVPQIKSILARMFPDNPEIFKQLCTLDRYTDGDLPRIKAADVVIISTRPTDNLNREKGWQEFVKKMAEEGVDISKIILMSVLANSFSTEATALGIQAVDTYRSDANVMSVVRRALKGNNDILPE